MLSYNLNFYYLVETQLLITFLDFQVEKELKDICLDILNMLDTNLIPYDSSVEGKVLYRKM